MNVLITGASRGIGAACAEAFAQSGNRLILNYNSSQEQASKLCSILSERCDCIAVKADVAEIEQIALLKQSADAYFKGGIDVLINNAGVSHYGLFNQAGNIEQINRMYAVNLFGTLNVTRAFIGDMINKNSGSVINISSIWGSVGASCEVDYSTAKAGIIGFTRALAKEVGLSGVRVNCIAPGVIDTDMNALFSAAEIQDIIDDIPLERLGLPSDIAKTALFLASEGAEYITGQVITVDGGYT